MAIVYKDANIEPRDGETSVDTFRRRFRTNYPLHQAIA